MTQENKELLLKDLCARLPYGVIVETSKGKGHVCDVNLTMFGTKVGVNISPTARDTFDIKDLQPYLFPSSSMTEEQWKEITDIQIKESLKSIDSNNDYMSNPLFSIGDLKTLDWCYANHIDYRGLIPMGLAIDATGLNIY